MDPHSVWAYVHILLFVFWLGGDIGALIGAILTKNPELSFEARSALLKLGLIVDQFPRVTFALMMPVGLQLTRDLELYPVTTELLIAGWTISILWVALIYVLFKSEGTPLAGKLVSVQSVFQAVMGAAFVYIGAVSLATGRPIGQDWFSLKLLLFGIVFWASMALEYVYRPFIIPFFEIGELGPTPEREAAVRKHLNRAITGVLFIYVLIAAIAFLGRVKPI